MRLGIELTYLNIRVGHKYFQKPTILGLDFLCKSEFF